ncbi:AI-2E family transporter [Cognatishimia activa]|uniref:AI-2E family transporter n=1 Tax=Cognatishimia activa TaxID=1715691 RepID=UPI00222F8192|nr:AI-2E family transporter [Cognatishimia activa]UZD90319.1 AI-2E family transporter [Cognatishimia activa]
MDINENEKANSASSGFVQLLALSCYLGLAVLIGWLCIIGKSVILPVLIGVIGVYLYVAAADALARFGGMKNLPRGVRRFTVIIFFLAILSLLVLFIAQNAQSISETVPVYAENLEVLMTQLLDSMGLETTIDWESIGTTVSETVSFGTIMEYLISVVYSFGSVVVSALLYAAFLAAELDDLPKKTEKAFVDQGKAASAILMANNINKRIGSYLGAKTLVNAILGVVSFVILLLLGVEFALFWALLIALFNYIPYIGSVVGVLFPVVIAFLQTGSWILGILAFVTLMAAQIYVGYVLEPRLLGRSVNLSPFMVLLALSFWMVVWGSIGAILAVPLTAVIMIILSEIPSVRPIAVMMSERGDV